MAIIKSGEIWRFSSEHELELEEIVWKNLKTILDLTSFKRQYSVKGQFCDILTLNDQNRLVVIELKDVEDRYVVQQLTRYYDALKEVSTFDSKVDTEQPIRLIAIAPSFNQATLTDCKYNRLEVELIHFQIQVVNDCLYLELLDAKEQSISLFQIQQGMVESPSVIAVPEPPRKLLNWLSDASEDEFNATMRMREQILGFDKRMKELIEPQRIIYGRGKSKPCCEFRKKGAYGFEGGELERFLWLPHPEGKPSALRMMIATDISEQAAVKNLLYCPSSSRSKGIWRFPGLTRVPGNYSRLPDSYKPFLDKELNCSLPSLTNLALHTWQERS
jgi:RecB family endonuclease NucS